MDTLPHIYIHWSIHKSQSLVGIHLYNYQCTHHHWVNLPYPCRVDNPLHSSLPHKSVFVVKIKYGGKG